MSKRIPVYKVCITCHGEGEVSQPSFYAGGGYNPYNTVKLCDTCNGTGKINTGMFIEDPYSLFENSE